MDLTEYTADARYPNLESRKEKDKVLISLKLKSEQKYEHESQRDQVMSPVFLKDYHAILFPVNSQFNNPNMGELIRNIC